MIATPAGISIWNVSVANQIDAASLDMVLADGSGVDFLIIGTGATLQPVDAALRILLREKRISCEVMTTPAAISTYHVLAGEARRVAAALIVVE